MRLCSAAPLGAKSMIRRNAVLVPFPHAFSINHLFLFSEFVSWTIIDCGEPPTAPRVALVWNNMASRPWSRQAWHLLLLTSQLGWKRGGWKEDWQAALKLREHLGNPWFGDLYLDLTLKFSIRDYKWKHSQNFLFSPVGLQLYNSKWF